MGRFAPADPGIRKWFPRRSPADGRSLGVNGGDSNQAGRTNAPQSISRGAAGQDAVAGAAVRGAAVAPPRCAAPGRSPSARSRRARPPPGRRCRGRAGRASPRAGVRPAWAGRPEAGRAGADGRAGAGWRGSAALRGAPCRLRPESERPAPAACAAQAWSRLRMPCSSLRGYVPRFACPTPTLAWSTPRPAWAQPRTGGQPAPRPAGRRSCRPARGRRACRYDAAAAGAAVRRERLTGGRRSRATSWRTRAVAVVRGGRSCWTAAGLRKIRTTVETELTDARIRIGKRRTRAIVRRGHRSPRPDGPTKNDHAAPHRKPRIVDFKKYSD